MKIRITKGLPMIRYALDRQMQKLMPQIGRCQRVVDIGSRRSPYRSLFQAEHFWSLDILEKFQPNVVGDAHLLPLQSGSLDLVIASQMLEHCKRPQEVVNEVWRVLAPGGRMVCSVPFNYIIHGDPSDYWRFTRYALEEIFKGYAQADVHPVGNHFAAVWDVATAGNSLLRYLNYVLRVFAYSKESRSPCGYLVIARK